MENIPLAHTSPLDTFLSTAKNWIPRTATQTPASWFEQYLQDSKVEVVQETWTSLWRMLLLTMSSAPAWHPGPQNVRDTLQNTYNHEARWNSVQCALNTLLHTMCSSPVKPKWGPSELPTIIVIWSPRTLTLSTTPIVSALLSLTLHPSHCLQLIRQLKKQSSSCSRWITFAGTLLTSLLKWLSPDHHVLPTLLCPYSHFPVFHLTATFTNK